MAGKPTAIMTLAAEVCRRWPSHPSRELARYLLARHPAVFRDIEVARDSVRTVRGAKGEMHRRDIKTRVERVAMPPSEARVPCDFVVPDGRWLLAGDVHVPFHDAEALRRMVKDGKARGVTGVLLLGDVQDAEAVGMFDVVGRRRDFLHEVEETIDFLDWLRFTFKGRPIVWQPGNHDERLEMYYAKHAPQLVDLPTATMAQALDLESRGVTMLERRQRAVVRGGTPDGDLVLLHGHTATKGLFIPVSPARTLMLRCKGNVLCGHHHRTSYHPERTVSRRPLACWSIGCLCGLEPDYNPDVSNWDHGHAFLDVRGKDWDVQLRRHLRDGRVVGG